MLSGTIGASCSGLVPTQLHATIVICMFITAVASIAIWIYLTIPTWKLRKVPSSPAFWLLGHLHLLAKHGPDVFMQLARKYGPIYRFQFLNSPSVLQFQFFHTLSGEISCFVTCSVIHIHQLHLLTMSMLTVVN